MAIFTLEALNAKHGDALLLHYGSAEEPRVVVIDGGPAGVGKRVLARLAALRDARVGADDPLPIELLMVSHIDDDHIRGVIDVLKSMEKAKDDRMPPALRIRKLWHNSFEGLLRGVTERPDTASAGFGDEVADDATLGDATAEEALQRASDLALASVGDAVADARTHLREHQGALVLASVAQGREVHRLARKLRIPLNAPFRGLVRRQRVPKVVELDDGLRLTVIGPDDERLEALRDDWKKKAALLDAKALATRLAEYADESVYNLSSIIAIAEFDVDGETRRMLLTGDARGDDILDALEAAGWMEGGRAHFDVVKLPHHGSDRNVEIDFFERVTADCYVISADGRHGNPDAPTLEMLTEARQGEAYTIVLTNAVAEVIALLDERLEDGHSFEVRVRDAHAEGISVHLGHPVGD